MESVTDAKKKITVCVKLTCGDILIKEVQYLVV